MALFRCGGSSAETLVNQVLTVTPTGSDQTTTFNDLTEIDYIYAVDSTSQVFGAFYNNAYYHAVNSSGNNISVVNRNVVTFKYNAGNQPVTLIAFGH